MDLSNMKIFLKNLFRREESKMKLYYAHSQWKYGTELEAYELDVIRAMFPGYHIINPSKDIPQCLGEREVMTHCVDAVHDSEIVVFSSVNGLIGKGVFTEIVTAIEADKRVFYLWYDALIPFKDVLKLELLEDTTTDRLYAKVLP